MAMQKAVPVLHGVTIGYVSDKPIGRYAAGSRLRLATTIRMIIIGNCDFDRSKLLAYSYQYSTKG